MASRDRMVRLVCAVGVAVAALAGCGGNSSGPGAQSSGTSDSGKSGTINMVAKFHVSGNASVVVTGLIEDRGRSFSADAHGKANGKANYQEVVLEHGTFLLDENALNSAKPKGGLNRSTCLWHYTFNAAVPVSLGTGSYAGIHGSLRVTGVVRYHVPRYRSGSRKGECNALAKPAAGTHTATMTGQGTVAY